MASESHQLHHPYNQSQLHASTTGGGPPSGRKPRSHRRGGEGASPRKSSRLTEVRDQRSEIGQGRRWAAMSRNNGKSPKVDLKLNLSLPRRGGSSSRAGADEDSSSPHGSSSPPSSCVSSESEQGLRCSNSPEATSMVLAGCPRCLMYVMLSEEDPKCPKCKSAVLLDFPHGGTTTTTKKTRKS